MRESTYGGCSVAGIDFLTGTTNAPTDTSCVKCVTNTNAEKNVTGLKADLNALSCILMSY